MKSDYAHTSRKNNKMADNVTEITTREFDNFVKGKGLVLIDFWAEWCMPCIIMSPIMEELGKKFKGKIKFGKINIDENHAIASKFRVVSIPNFILFENGEVKERFVGTMYIEDFAEKLKKHL